MKLDEIVQAETVRCNCVASYVLQVLGQCQPQNWWFTSSVGSAQLPDTRLVR